MQCWQSTFARSSSAARARVTARGEHNDAQQLPAATRVSAQSSSFAQGASSAAFTALAARGGSLRVSPRGRAASLRPRVRTHSSCVFSAASAAVIGAAAPFDGDAAAGADWAGCAVWAAEELAGFCSLCRSPLVPAQENARTAARALPIHLMAWTLTERGRSVKPFRRARLDFESALPRGIACSPRPDARPAMVP